MTIDTSCHTASLTVHDLTGAACEEDRAFGATDADCGNGKEDDDIDLVVPITSIDHTRLNLCAMTTKWIQLVVSKPVLDVAIRRSSTSTVH